MEHVKESMDSALHTAEDGIGSAIHKIEEAIGIKKDESDHLAEEMKEAVEGFEEASEDAARDAADSTNKMVDGVIEEVSEAETVSFFFFHKMTESRQLFINIKSLVLKWERLSFSVVLFESNNSVMRGISELKGPRQQTIFI